MSLVKSSPSDRIPQNVGDQIARTASFDEYTVGIGMDLEADMMKQPVMKHSQSNPAGTFINALASRSQDTIDCSDASNMDDSGNNDIDNTNNTKTGSNPPSMPNLKLDLEAVKTLPAQEDPHAEKNRSRSNSTTEKNRSRSNSTTSLGLTRNLSRLFSGGSALKKSTSTAKLNQTELDEEVHLPPLEGTSEGSAATTPATSPIKPSTSDKELKELQSETDSMLQDVSLEQAEQLKDGGSQQAEERKESPFEKATKAEDVESIRSVTSTPESFSSWVNLQDKTDNIKGKKTSSSKSKLFKNAHKVKLATLTNAKIDIDKEMRLTSITALKHLCDGKVSNIYKGTWQGQNVIVKRMMPGYESDFYLNEFKFELETLQRTQRCPHIVNVLGAGYDKSAMSPRKKNNGRSSLPFILLERLNGGSLTYKLTKKRFPANRPFRSNLECYTYMISLAEALHFLHYDFDASVHVIHRDLKPDNVAFDADGHLKLIDFGLSICVKRTEKDNEVYQMTGETGSMRYMAPEVIFNKPYNQSVDVYSFGIIMWEMVTGIVPFAGLTRENFAQKVVTERLRPPLGIDPFGERIHQSEVLMELIQSCWAHDYKHRPSINQVVDVLKTVKENERQTPAESCTCVVCEGV
jgi:hypothetical protein